MPGCPPHSPRARHGCCQTTSQPPRLSHGAGTARTGKEPRMSDRELIDGLIATYRTLNFTVRPHPEAQLRAASPHGSVRQAVTRLRDRELRFADALKARLTGVHMPELFDEAVAPVVGTESDADTTTARLSQFGTAREATLVRLRSVSEAAWDQ